MMSHVFSQPSLLDVGRPPRPQAQPATEPSPIAGGQPWPDRFVDGTEPGRAGILELALRALALRAGSTPKRQDGARAAALFLSPSLRTRASLAAACDALGVHLTTLSPGRDAWALEMTDGAVMDGDAAEHVREAAGVLSQYADLLAVRAFAGLTDLEDDRQDPTLSAFCRHADAKVVNLESALWHPLQGLADTATWCSHLGGDLRGKRLTVTWAPHPKALPLAVTNQTLLSAAMHGMDITLAHPRGFEIDPLVYGRIANRVRSRGGDVRVLHDQQAAMKGAQVVVAKSWGGLPGYDDRALEAQRRADLGHWCVDERTMSA
ncbi:MAG: hypothetical protein QF464_18675, partial [Myxococcota bacterium]|nr:hypothetical protein [Myxococcota bacterium]